MTGHCGAERVSVLCSRSCSDMGGVGVHVRARKNKCSVHIPVRAERLFVIGQRHPLQTLMYCTNDKVMDSLGTTKAAFDEGAQAAMQLHAPPHGPEYLNVIVSTEDLGPKPATFKELTDTGPDHNNFHITETYSLESVHMVCKLPANRRKPYYVYDYGFQDHVFSDRPEGKRASAVQGWFASMRCRFPRRDGMESGREGPRAREGSAQCRQVAQTSRVTAARRHDAHNDCSTVVSERAGPAPCSSEEEAQTEGGACGHSHEGDA